MLTISKYCVLNISYFMYSIDMPAGGAVQTRSEPAVEARAPSPSGGAQRSDTTGRHVNVFLRVKRWIQTVFCSVPSDRAKMSR